MNPDFSYEKELLLKNYKFIGGIDEVGRGALAGPVFTACVVFSEDFIKSFKSLDIVIRDSKKMSERQREIASLWIKKNALYFAVSAVDVNDINKRGISESVFLGFDRVVRSVVTSSHSGVDFLLIDGKIKPNFGLFGSMKNMTIIGGDGKSFTIAAASIIAKVERDLYMQKLSLKHPDYLWEKNKGYGTLEHRNAIKNFGATKHHRNIFIRKVLSEV